LAYPTNETVFDLTAAPRSLAILGGNAIGCELAQAIHDSASR
jgi:pyruvate/2-oxoglutarate dehydrogenase complex dihydrolipoamide dehydrogenase (E3) component